MMAAHYSSKVLTATKKMFTVFSEILHNIKHACMLNGIKAPGKNAHVTRRQKLAIADADKSRGK